MRIWFALIVAPLLALTDQTVAFALVGWECAHQSLALLHGSHAFFLAIATTSAVVAWQLWRNNGAGAPAHGDEGTLQLRSLAGIAAAVASLSALAITAMWIPIWMISPCVA